MRTGQSLLPIFDLEFFELLLEYFGNRGEQIVVCSSARETVAVGIVRPGRPFVWETFQPSQAPVAAWIVDGSVDPQQLYGSIVRALPGICLQLGITQQDPLVNVACDSIGLLRRLDYVDIARLELTGNFDEYWAARGKNLKQNLRRQRKRLERDAVSIRCEVLANADVMKPAVDRYCDIECRGWKSEMGTALTRDSVQARFYGALMERYALLGAARVFELYFGEQLVAIDLCLCRDDTLIVLKTTHDEHVQQMSPSMLLKQEMIRLGYESGEFRCVEFYGKAMDWHRRLTDDLRRMYHVNAFRNSMFARLHDMRSKWFASSGGKVESVDASGDLPEQAVE